MKSLKTNRRSAAGRAPLLLLWLLGLPLPIVILIWLFHG